MSCPHSPVPHGLYRKQMSMPGCLMGWGKVGCFNLKKYHNLQERIFLDFQGNKMRHTVRLLLLQKVSAPIQELFDFFHH